MPFSAPGAIRYAELSHCPMYLAQDRQRCPAAGNNLRSGTGVEPQARNSLKSRLAAWRVVVHNSAVVRLARRIAWFNSPP